MASAIELVQIDLSPRVPRSKPEWLKARAPRPETAALFMLPDDPCPRRSGCCAVPKGKRMPIDSAEPRRVAEAVRTLGLKFAVVTSVNRDDDNFGGARVFAEPIRQIRQQ